MTKKQDQLVVILFSIEIPISVTHERGRGEERR
jgi:hypothetical protein